MITVLRDANSNTRFQSTFPSEPASSHPASFIMNILAGRWRFGQKMSDPFIPISFLKIYTQAFRHLIEKPEKAWGRIMPGNHFGTMHFFFPETHSIQSASISSEHQLHHARYLLRTQRKPSYLPFWVDNSKAAQDDMTIVTLNSLSSHHLSLRHSLRACRARLLPRKQPCIYLLSCP